MPKRLLLLDSKGGSSGRLRLVDAREQLVTEQHTALSYCWGDGPTFLATRGTFARLRSGIDQAELPAVMRDFVTVAVQLGIRYI